MKRDLCIALALIASSMAPIGAQNYNHSYGSSRVVDQNNNGLASPSSSYIGSGTMSKSAQGTPAAAQTNPGLPRVNMGANVRTPGDNLYRQPAPRTQQNSGLPPGRMGANVGMPGDSMRSDLHYYQPGQNAGPRPVQARQRAQPTGHVYQPGSNGAAANYGAQGYGTPGGGARHF